MRVLGQSAVLVLLAAGAVRAVQTPATDPATVLAAAREALGGEKRLAAVKSFVATGRTQQVRGDNLVPIEFEISCELPDKYARRDEIPAQGSGPTTIGFSGDDLIQLPLAAAPVARAGGPPPPTPAQLDAQRRARAITAKQDFVRLTLGMFAGSFSGYPLAFTYVGQAEAPQGKADVIDVKGPDTFSVRLFIYRDTHLPIMVSWQAPASNAGRGAPGQASPPLVEYRLYYADYRDVDGLKFPFRLRRAVGPDTIEETTFDRYRINHEDRSQEVRDPEITRTGRQAGRLGAMLRSR